MYRTISIADFDDLKPLEKYETDIEDSKIQETITNGKTNPKTATIIFKDISAMEKFIEKEHFFTHLETSTYAESTFIFKTVLLLIFVKISLFILITLLCTNYFKNINKAISLYQVLGFSKIRLLSLLTILFGVFTLLLYLIDYCISYLIYLLIWKIEIIDIYYSILNIDIKTLFTIILALILSLIVVTLSDSKIAYKNIQ